MNDVIGEYRVCSGHRRKSCISPASNVDGRGRPSGAGRPIRTHQMSQDTDASNAVVRPPVAWIVALITGVAADWLYPLRFVPASVPGAWVGGGCFPAAVALAIWALVTIPRAGPHLSTYTP